MPRKKSSLTMKNSTEMSSFKPKKNPPTAIDMSKPTLPTP